MSEENNPTWAKQIARGEIVSPFLRGVLAASEYLGVSVRTVNRWMKSNRIPYAKPGGVLLFRRDALDAAIESFTVRARREG